MFLKSNYVKVVLVLLNILLMEPDSKAQSSQLPADSVNRKYQLPNGQYGNVPHNESPPVPEEDRPLPPDAYSNVGFDIEHDTKIYGKVKRTDGVDSTVFYLKKEPLPAKERIVKEGSEFLLLNVLLSPKRSFQKILVKVLSNPPSNNFVGDTGWIELSHTTLYPYYDNTNNFIDSDYIYKKYANAAIKFRNQADSTTCHENRKCLLSYAIYYDCLAQSEHTHTEPKCKTKDCTIVDCPGDEKKK